MRYYARGGCIHSFAKCCGLKVLIKAVGFCLTSKCFTGTRLPAAYKNVSSGILILIVLEGRLLCVLMECSSSSTIFSQSQCFDSIRLMSLHWRYAACLLYCSSSMLHRKNIVSSCFKSLKQIYTLIPIKK